MPRKLLSIHFRNISNRRIESFPVTYGVPLAHGTLRSSQALSVQLADGQKRNVQARPLEFHADASVKWLLLDFSLPLEANEKGTVTLLDGEVSLPPSQMRV